MKSFGFECHALHLLSVNNRQLMLLERVVADQNKKNDPA
jgi:hypothetical protein